jgi:dihydrofolate reductase
VGELDAAVRRIPARVRELDLTIHPLVLGSGLRMFPDPGALARFRLVESTPATTGVIIAVYER